MIRFTQDEFNKVREAIVTAHLFNQQVTPLLKKLAFSLDENQHSLLIYSPELVSMAFSIIVTINHRENHDLADNENDPPTKLMEIDRFTFRDELENVSALVFPDIVYEMICALGELPMYHETLTAEPFTTNRAGTLMAWTWEAGRRYGIQQSLAIVDCTTSEFKAGTDAALMQVLDAPLDLPAAEGDQPGLTLVTEKDTKVIERKPN